MSFYTVVSILFLVFVLCGSSTAKRDSRILGGTTAANGQYPYQVSLRTQGSHFCGGSILNTRWILTAAHCLQSIVDQISVVVGTNVISSGGDTYLAGGYIIHPLFVNSSRLYDAALVNTKTAIVYSSKVRPVSLTTLVPVDAAVAVITGWGSENNESGGYVDNLKTLNVIVINETSCSVISHGFTHLCTISSSGGACWYDDGGPVTVCNLQIGIVSYTLCAQSIPDAHTKISSIYGWIMSYMSTIDVSQ